MINVKNLVWRKPTDHPQDMQCAQYIADGIGGRYAIERTADGCLLWLADDEFTWASFFTVENAKAYAQRHHETAVRLLIEVVP